MHARVKILKRSQLRGLSGLAARDLSSRSLFRQSPVTRRRVLFEASTARRDLPLPPPSDLHPNISEFKAHRVHLSALTARTARRSVNKRTKPNSSKRWLHYFMNGTGLALPRPVTSIPPRDFSRPREKKRAFGPRDRDHAHANGERRPFRFVSEQRTT